MGMDFQGVREKAAQERKEKDAAKEVPEDLGEALERIGELGGMLAGRRSGRRGAGLVESTAKPESPSRRNGFIELD